MARKQFPIYRKKCLDEIFKGADINSEDIIQKIIMEKELDELLLAILNKKYRSFLKKKVELISCKIRDSKTPCLAAILNMVFRTTIKTRTNYFISVIEICIVEGVLHAR